uniref:Protein kinase domain-containing protein n=1 Tax=Heligmosomoides polygyrus TaxID=6339 RepID=A0A183G1X8_HELPZ
LYRLKKEKNESAPLLWLVTIRKVIMVQLKKGILCEKRVSPNLYHLSALMSTLAPLCMRSHQIEASFFEYAIHFMRLLRHPHIVDLHSCFVDGPSIYLILGACNYGIATFLYSEACGLPEKAIALILRHLLSALTYLHAQQIIHRWVPGLPHLLLDSTGGVRLTGFRLARKLAPGQSTTTDFDSHLESSLLWLAPEVLGQVRTYASRSDIYSVGATLCEMANGFPPFGDMNRLEMLYEKSRGTTPRLLDSTTLPSFEALKTGQRIPEPSEHSCRTFTEAFHSITGMCLKANPANRYDRNGICFLRYFISSCFRRGGEKILWLTLFVYCFRHVQLLSLFLSRKVDRY